MSSGTEKVPNSRPGHRPRQRRRAARGTLDAATGSGRQGGGGYIAPTTIYRAVWRGAAAVAAAARPRHREGGRAAADRAGRASAFHQ